MCPRQAPPLIIMLHLVGFNSNIRQFATPLLP